MMMSATCRFTRNALPPKTYKTINSLIASSVLLKTSPACNKISRKVVNISTVLAQISN